MTPIAKPLPTKGSITEGTIPRGISWKSIASIIGRLMVNAAEKEPIDFVECAISKPADSCVHIRKRRITPIT
jgi:hypothetical protein